MSDTGDNVNEFWTHYCETVRSAGVAEDLVPSYFNRAKAFAVSMRGSLKERSADDVRNYLRKIRKEGGDMAYTEARNALAILYRDMLHVHLRHGTSSAGESFRDNITDAIRCGTRSPPIFRSPARTSARCRT